MLKNLCDCLTANDWPCVKKQIDNYLGTVNKNNEEEVIVAGFKKWLLSNQCVQEVNVQQGLIETNPPIKQFNLKITTAGGIVEKNIGIQISKKVLKANIY